MHANAQHPCLFYDKRNGTSSAALTRPLPCLRRYVKIHLIPLDASRACAFYCCTALEPQSQMSFNEGFCIPVPANTLAVCALQLCVCSLGPQAQEELLVGLNAPPPRRDGSRTAAS